MKLLGIDYGKKRIGLASGDTDTRMAFALTTIDGSDPNAAIAEIGRVAKQEGCEKLVVGIPVPLAKADGTPRKNVEAEARAFAAKLAEVTGLPVDTEDERLSSRAADRVRTMSETKKDKFDRDAVAAALVLETYLERTHGNVS